MIVTNEKHLKILQEVLSLPTAPFHEQMVIRYIKDFAASQGMAINQDIYGNLLLEYHRGPIGPALGVMAHMDHPGFEVTAIDDDGRIRLDFLGGIACPHPGDKLILYDGQDSARLEVVEICQTEKQSRPTRLIAQGKWSKPTGFAMTAMPPFRRQGNKIHSRAVDDLAGCAALIALIQLLGERQPQAHVHIIFTRAEEVGFIGACGMAMGNILPRSLPIISLEASKVVPGAEQGQGVVIRVGDAFCIFDPEITSFLTRIAKDLGKSDSQFKYQRQILDGGTCEASLLYTFGYPTSGLAVPLGCYHNHGKDGKLAAEHIHLHDWYNMIELLWAAITGSENLIAWQQSGQASFINKFSKYRHRIVIGKNDIL